MNNDLSLWDGALLLPSSFEQACGNLERLEAQRPGPNPKFLALAQALQIEPPASAGWPQILVQRAQHKLEAVWHLSLPADDLVTALRAVVERATALGLVVFSEALGMVFLPGGAVLPPAMQEQWAELTAQHALPPLTKVEVAQLTATLMRERLAKHGFLPRRISDDWDAQFVRPTSDGFQSVQMRIIGELPLLRCVVRCGHRCEEAEAIFAQVFGPDSRTSETFWFNPSAFVGSAGGGLPAENSAEIRTALDVVESHGLPPLDLASQPGGLNGLMNEPQRFPLTTPGRHPLAPKNLADEYVSYGENLCLKPLIVAWLARSPAFEQRVDDLRKFVQSRVDVSEKDLDRLVEHLRALPA